MCNAHMHMMQVSRLYDAATVMTGRKTSFPCCIVRIPLFKYSLKKNRMWNGRLDLILI